MDALLSEKLSAATDDFNPAEPHNNFLLHISDPVVQFLSNDPDHDIKLAELEPLESHLFFQAFLAGDGELFFFQVCQQVLLLGHQDVVPSTELTERLLLLPGSLSFSLVYGLAWPAVSLPEVPGLLKLFLVDLALNSLLQALVPLALHEYLAHVIVAVTHGGVRYQKLGTSGDLLSKLDSVLRLVFVWLEDLFLNLGVPLVLFFFLQGCFVLCEVPPTRRLEEPLV